MTTWTSKGLLAGAFCLALAGCDDLVTSGTASGANALRAAKLARGAVTLVPPPGYCIDKRSLRANFAVMARCDTLGGTETFGAPLAVITATTLPATTGGTEPEPQSEAILSRRKSPGLTFIQINGTPPSPDMRDVFWRGTGRVGDQVLGLAIYEAKDGIALGELAPDLLAQTMRRTKGETERAAAAVQDNSATTAAKPAENG